MLRAIIIDDIPKAIITLEQDLNLYAPMIKIVGKATSVIEGVKLLNKVETDILFLDIELGDGNGFDILEMIPDKNFNVIFTTGSDAFAIQAFRFSAIDYLLKPIDPDELVSAINKVKIQTANTKEQFDVLKSHISGSSRDGKIALATQELIKITKISDITFCKSDGNYTTFHFSSDKPLMVSGSIKNYEELLVNHAFFRTHQSYLVNLDYVSAYVKSEGGYLQMLDQTRIPVSVRKKSLLIDKLKNQPL